MTVLHSMVSSFPAPHAGLHRRAVARLDADDLDVRIERPGRHGDARDQPAAADGNDDGVDVVPVLDDLESDGALPRDELLVVERVDVGESFGSHQLLRLLIGVIPDGAVENDLRAVGPGGGDLRRCGVGGHADHGPDAVDLRGERDALGMIAGRGADDAAALLLLGHEGELVEGTADFVRADALEQLGLEPCVVPRGLTELARGEERRVLDVRSNALAHFAEVVEGEGVHLRKMGRE